DLAKGQPKPITINMIAETNYELRPQLSIVESITLGAPRLSKEFVKFEDAWDAISRFLTQTQCL
ncbi:MAG: hypothetical protein ACKEQK_00640, partial [Candidatus Hodgkinia cicadicola]